MLPLVHAMMIPLALWLSGSLPCDDFFPQRVALRCAHQESVSLFVVLQARAAALAALMFKLCRFRELAAYRFLSRPSYDEFGGFLLDAFGDELARQPLEPLVLWGCALGGGRLAVAGDAWPW